MGKYSLEITNKAKQDLAIHYKSGNKTIIKKIELIFNELEIHPTSGTGKPEQLKYNLTGYWSRRINQKDRLIYRIEEDVVTVIVVSALGHYEK